MRQVMLGLDRHWNRYWLLSGPRIRARRADDRVPIVCVETQATVPFSHHTAHSRGFA